MTGTGKGRGGSFLNCHCFCFQEGIFTQIDCISAVDFQILHIQRGPGIQSHCPIVVKITGLSQIPGKSLHEAAFIDVNVAGEFVIFTHAYCLVADIKFTFLCQICIGRTVYTGTYGNIDFRGSIVHGNQVPTLGTAQSNGSISDNGQTGGIFT